MPRYATPCRHRVSRYCRGCWNICFSHSVLAGHIPSRSAYDTSTEPKFDSVPSHILLSTTYYWVTFIFLTMSVILESRELGSNTWTFNRSVVIIAIWVKHLCIVEFSQLPVSSQIKFRGSWVAHVQVTVCRTWVHAQPSTTHQYHRCLTGQLTNGHTIPWLSGVLRNIRIVYFWGKDDQIYQTG